MASTIIKGGTCILIPRKLFFIILATDKRSQCDTNDLSSWWFAYYSNLDKTLWMKKCSLESASSTAVQAHVTWSVPTDQRCLHEICMGVQAWGIINRQTPAVFTQLHTRWEEWKWSKSVKSCPRSLAFWASLLLEYEVDCYPHLEDGLTQCLWWP